MYRLLELKALDDLSSQFRTDRDNGRSTAKSFQR